MKVQVKLFLAILPLAFFLVFIGLYSVSTISQLSTNSQSILKDNFHSVLAVQKMIEAIERIDSAALFRLTGKVSESEALFSKFKEVFEEQLRFEETNITEPGEQEAVHLLRKNWMEFKNQFEHFATLSAEEGKHEYHSTLHPLFLTIKSSTDHILTMNQDSMRQKSDHVQEVAQRMNHLTIFILIIATISGIFLSVFFGRQTLRPLSILSQAVRRVGEGDLEARTLIQGSDEIAELAKEFNLMAEHLLQYRHSSIGELLLAEQASQAAIDSLPDPVVIVDPKGTLLNVNKAAETEFNIRIDFEKIKGEEAVDPSLKASIERVSRHILSGKGEYVPKGFDEAIRIQTPNGEKFFLSRGNPLLHENRIIGATVILQDVTRLRLFDQLKSDLVSTVAHEFRTPLTSLRMAIHLLLEGSVGPISEKQADLLYSSREDCERLQAMVDDLLDISRIQDGKIRMRLETISAQSLTESTLSTHRLLAEKNNQQLISHLPPEEVFIQADFERIQLVLKNLIVNAFRHTPPQGTIAIRLTHNETCARFEVEDTGPGIPTEFQERIFEKFFRIPGTPGAGTGLGLSISKEIIEAHQGKIGLQSGSGQGSIFWFTLPLAPKPS